MRCLYRNNKILKYRSLRANLYTDYYYLFIIASFILLVAMIGAIVLTHELGAELKRQDLFTQTSRSLWQ